MTFRFWQRITGLSGTLIALLTCGCSATSVINSLASRQGFDVTRGESYGPGPRRTLDVYRPNGAASAPVVVFFYGGSWQNGAKEDYTFVGSALARLGYVVMIPDYRVYPEVKFPAFLQDAASAVKWAKRNATRHGGNPNQVFVMGHSAGAHIAAMVTLDRRWLAAEGLSADHDIRGLIGISGPYDFLPLEDDTLKVIFGGDRVKATQPINYAGRGHPPALLVTGTSDTTVLPRNTRNLAAKLRANGNRAEDLYYDGAGHAQTVGAFADQLRFLAPVVRDVDVFIKRESGSAARRAVPQ